jgi:hypothetical protein
MVSDGDTYKICIDLVHKLYKRDSDAICSCCITIAPSKTSCFLKNKFYKINTFYASFCIATMAVKKLFEVYFNIIKISSYFHNNLIFVSATCYMAMPLAHRPQRDSAKMGRDPSSSKRKKT